MVIAPLPGSVAALAVQRPPVAPIGELGCRPLGVARAGKLHQDALEIVLGLALVAGQRPAFRKPREIFAAIVLGEPGEGALPEREGSLEGGSRARCEIAGARRVALAAC